MSRCYYFKTEYCVDFIGMQEILEMIFDLDYEGSAVSFYMIEPSAGEREAASFYIKGKSARGVQIINKEGYIIIKMNSLCNDVDYELAREILRIERDFLKTQIIDKDDSVIELEDCFSEENIQQLREEDAKNVLIALKTIVKDYMQIPGAVRSVYFGKQITEQLIQYENNPAELVKAFDKIMSHVQYELPDYNMPGAALIRPKDSEDEKDFKKIRMMFEGTPYILQDYDYLMLRPDKKTQEIIFIDNKDLHEIASMLFAKDSGFEFADDFTAVFPKLEGDEWNQFVDLAREKNHKELLENVPAAKAVNLTPDYDPETEKEDNYQYHGNHWECILDNPEDEIVPLISESVEKGFVYGKEICHYKLDEKLHGVAAILEYNKGDGESPIVVRSVIATNKDNKNVLVSGYPVIKRGLRLSLKISEIKEWENGLEGWITGELPDGRKLTFFDADFAITKEKYEVGETCNFYLAAFAYSAKEPESKGFKFEGQKAIDFKAKLGEEPEYDEDGNVKPVEFSTETLCAFMQTGPAPDEAEYITTVDEVKSVKAFGKNFWTFDVIYRNGDDDSVKIPAFVLQSAENESILNATQLQGMLWLVGYVVS